MATTVIMPKQGQSVETCIITKWFKQTGDNVSVGDILYSYETDKAAFDHESTAEGVLLEILFPEGSEVPVLANVAYIGNKGEKLTFELPEKNIPATAMPETISPPLSEKKITLASAIEQSSKSEVEAKIVRISPRAKRMAKEKGIDISILTGTGPNGRIIAADIDTASPAKHENDVTYKRPVPNITSGGDYTDQPLSNVRKIISKAMLASLQNSAQLTHHMSADVRRLLNAREKVKKEVAENSTRQDLTLNDMICWCVIRALEKFPEANSHFLGEQIRTFKTVHLGLAVDTPRGLMVPAVRNAGDMHLNALSKALKSAAASCKKGSITPELLQSDAATFTVSNLGNYGVEIFTPVLNLPQVCILGVCTIINRPASLGSNIFGFVPYIGLSLTYDHRAIDGGPATLFLREIKTEIENFNLI